MPPQKTTKRPRKQTTDRVSRIAAKLVAKYRKIQANENVEDDALVLPRDDVGWADLVTVCMSVLSQDETKGRRK